jgi:hypothetical protein
MELTIQRYERYFRELITFLYSWLSTDGEVLGYILGVCHVMICVSVGVCSIISHTLYPVTWLQILVFVFLVIVWLQHIFLKVCVVFVAEHKLTNKDPPFYEIIRDIFHIDPTQFTIHFIIAETIAVGCFGLELISKLSIYIYSINNIQL